MEALLLGTCERVCNPKKRKEHSEVKTYYRHDCSGAHWMVGIFANQWRTSKI